MIKFSEVTKDFGDLKVLEKISFEIKSGEFVFLIGPSGSGKTTLIKLILKEYLPTSGKIKVGGVDLAEINKKKLPEYRRRIGVAFQDFKLVPDQTVFENLAWVLKFLGREEGLIEARVHQVLKDVGLKERADFFPAQLAGGELQRACLARAVVAEPEIVIADEPTGNLDLTTAVQIVDLLKKINQKKTTVLMATHNFEIVNRYQQRVISLDKGKIISDKKKGKYQT